MSCAIYWGQNTRRLRRVMGAHFLACTISFFRYLANTINSGEAATMSQKLLYSSRIRMSAQDSSNPYSYYSRSELLRRIADVYATLLSS